MFVPENLSKFFTPRYLASGPMSSDLPASPAVAETAQAVHDANVGAAEIEVAAVAVPQTLPEFFDANRLRSLLPVAVQHSGPRIDAVIPFDEPMTSSDSDDAD